MEKDTSSDQVKIIDRDSAFFGQIGNVVPKDPKLSKNPGHLVKLPNGKTFAFAPDEVEFVH